MRMSEITNKLIASLALLLISSACLAHEGLHGAGQLHVGEGHWATIEFAMLGVAIAVLSALGVKYLREKD